MGKRILIIDAERLIRGEEVFVPALVMAFHKAGYEPERVESNNDALARMNLFYDRDASDFHKSRLTVKEGREFNPDGIQLIVARMGHTRARSDDRFINEQADPYHFSLQYPWDYTGGHSLVKHFDRAQDRNGYRFERPTIQSKSIPWVIGVSAGQLEEDAQSIDRSVCLHDVVFHTLPDYNIIQPKSLRLTSSTVKTPQEGVERVVESTRQLIGQPMIGLC